MRDLRGIAEWSDGAVKRLAILADGVMDCPDLAVFLLDHLVARGVIGVEVIGAYLDNIPPVRRRD